MKKITKNNKGFSLVELIVVIAIMAVLMAVLVPTLVKNVEKSRLQTDKSALAELRQSVLTALANDKFVDCEASGGVTLSDGTLDIESLFDTTKGKGTDLVTEVQDTVGGDTIKLKSALDTTSDDTKVTLHMDARNGLVVLDVDAADEDYDFHITASGEHEGVAKDCSECNTKAPVASSTTTK